MTLRRQLSKPKLTSPNGSTSQVTTKLATAMLSTSPPESPNEAKKNNAWTNFNKKIRFREWKKGLTLVKVRGLVNEYVNPKEDEVRIGNRTYVSVDSAKSVNSTSPLLKSFNSLEIALQKKIANLATGKPNDPSPNIFPILYNKTRPTEIVYSATSPLEGNSSDVNFTLWHSDQKNIPNEIKLNPIKKIITCSCMFGDSLFGRDSKGHTFQLIKHDIDLYDKQQIDEIIYEPDGNLYETQFFNDLKAQLDFYSRYTDEKPTVAVHLPIWDYIKFGIQLYTRQKIKLDALNDLFTKVLEKGQELTQSITAICKQKGFDVLISSPFESFVEPIKSALNDEMKKEEGNVAAIILKELNIPFEKSEKVKSDDFAKTIVEDLPKPKPNKKMVKMLGLIKYLLKKNSNGELVENLLNKLAIPTQNKNNKPAKNRENPTEAAFKLEIQRLKDLGKTAQAAKLERKMLRKEKQKDRKETAAREKLFVKADDKTHSSDIKNTPSEANDKKKFLKPKITNLIVTKLLASNEAVAEEIFLDLLQNNKNKAIAEYILKQLKISASSRKSLVGDLEKENDGDLTSCQCEQIARKASEILKGFMTNPELAVIESWIQMLKKPVTPDKIGNIKFTYQKINPETNREEAVSETLFEFMTKEKNGFDLNQLTQFCKELDNMTRTKDPIKREEIEKRIDNILKEIKHKDSLKILELCKKLDDINRSDDPKKYEKIEMLIANTFKEITHIDSLKIDSQSFRLFYMGLLWKSLLQSTVKNRDDEDSAFYPILEDTINDIDDLFNNGNGLWVLLNIAGMKDYECIVSEDINEKPIQLKADALKNYPGQQNQFPNFTNFTTFSSVLFYDQFTTGNNFNFRHARDAMKFLTKHSIIAGKKLTPEEYRNAMSQPTPKSTYDESTPQKSFNFTGRTD